MIKVIAVGLTLLLGGCAPLLFGAAAGLALSRHEIHRNWCIQYYGNPSCFKNGHPTAYTYRMPAGL